MEEEILMPELEELVKAGHMIIAYIKRESGFDSYVCKKTDEIKYYFHVDDGNLRISFNQEWKSGLNLLSIPNVKGV